MINFPAGVIFIWSGTNASIPSGWERVTDLDGLYLKGTANATDPNDTGGAATHTHTVSATHTHTLTNHTHTVTVANGSSGGIDTGGDPASGGATITHNHTSNPYTSGNPASVTIGNGTVTYASLSNDPPYYTVIYITPTSGVSYFPNSAIAFLDDPLAVENSSTLVGFYVCDGTDSTPNLINKYLKGAGTGADAGGTGGSTENVHNLTHTHTTTHTHANITTGAAATKNRSDSGSTAVAATHTHTITIPAATPTTSDTPTATGAEVVEPAYTKLTAVQNRSGGDKATKGLVGMWLGTLASIPGNYLLCDGTNGTTDMRGKYLKCGAIADIGDTGGSNTHTHASTNHTHTIANHTHTISNLTHTNGVEPYSSGSTDLANASTVHTVTTSSVTMTFSDAATEAQSSSNEPSYRTVAFIKLGSLSNNSNFLLMADINMY